MWGRLSARVLHMWVQDMAGLGTMNIEGSNRCMGYSSRGRQPSDRRHSYTGNNHHRGNDMLQPSISLALDLALESQFCWMDLNHGIVRPVDMPKKLSLGPSRLFSDISYG